ncbi:aldo/keto reductase [Candidatus Moduliflexus flocculans]|uniref:Aldo/keto reductase n=1 Tax=Candidatus Moduliflexus flocculans TaxID=1499966 RepID=A0A0S6W4E0_9BACT|nr:aldo/keto reductase [Candidatus Moduliflexus flocculans]
MVSRSGFGAIPIQRISIEASTRLLRKAFEQGINFFDTAKGYTDSEEKIGHALRDVRSQITLATKSPASDKKGVLADIDNSLRRLQTDYIDILQLHNPSYVPRPGDEHGMYDALLEAKASGKIRFLGLTNHRLHVAREAVESDLYDTIQFPFNLLSDAKDLELIQIAKQHDVGAIAMKALSGGLITNAASAFAFLRQYDNVVPIWGIELESQLDEFLAFEQQPPVLDDAMRQSIERDRRELSGAFCRGCGYCLPCPVEIPIPMAARMALLMGRMPYQQFLSAEWKERMERIPQCIDCRQCASRCPYELDTPALLKREYAAYQEFARQHAV